MTGIAQIDVAENLLALARGGDSYARRQLYTELAPATFALIRRLVVSRPVAEDLFQDTMIVMYERLDTFRHEAPLGAWVRQIAVSKCLMYLRSPWHRARLSLSEEDFEPAMPASLITAEIRPETFDVERALASLSPTARAVVWLHEVEGYSHEDIARSFGRSVSFSKSQLARAHRSLRQWFDRRPEREPCAPI